MKVDVGELADDLVEEVGLREPSDLDVEVELLYDLSRPQAEPSDVATEVPSNLAWVIEESAKVEGRGIEEALSRNVFQHRVNVFNPTFQCLATLQNGGLRWLQHTVQAAEDGQREDDFAVLRLLVVAA